MISEELQKKIDRAIRLLKSIENAADENGKVQPIEVAYSGGKDSDVILQLAKESGINFKAIYKCTTIDPPGTVKHARDMKVEIRKPREGNTFFKLIQKKGLPSRWHRFCCSDLKEYKILDKCIMGVRREESAKRAKRYQEPTECRFYGSKKKHVEAIYPILDWTLQDVADFIEDRGIVCAPTYYDEQGVFHPERRLGCLCCPLMSVKKRREAFKQYPKMLYQYCKNLKIFYDAHPRCSVVMNFGNPYYHIAYDLKFIKRGENRSGNLFDIDYKKSLEEYFNVELP